MQNYFSGQNKMCVCVIGGGRERQTVELAAIYACVGIYTFNTKQANVIRCSFAQGLFMLALFI